MKQTRKLLAILLTLVLAMSAICVTAFAAHKKQYQSYVFFGDSVTTGFGLQSYSDVAEEGGTAEGKRVPGAYPDLVAKGVGIDENNENYYNEAHSGWRTSELRETLDPSYNNDDGAVAKALSEGMANGKTLCDPQDPELQAKVREEMPSPTSSRSTSARTTSSCPSSWRCMRPSIRSMLLISDSRNTKTGSSKTC